MRKENSLKIKRVLYVTTQITATQRYFSWASFPSIWYARIQKMVLDLLLKTDVQLFVKFYPNDHLSNPNQEYIRQFPRVSLLEDSLINVLKYHDFDLIVTEAFATTMLEILCTKSQVVVFAPKDFVRLFVEAKETLKKRIFLVEDLKTYFRVLREILNKDSKIVPKEINDDFLLKFGLQSSQMNPTNAAREALESIIRKRQPL